MKVLIANRGEIAVRVIRACHDLGLETVAIYSEADAESLHVLLADEAICIGQSSSLSSYLKVANIISACEITGADAVHPGYGFHSENANFASICESCGLTFIGPSSQAISLLGDKAKAKAIAKKTKCPVIPGSDGIITNLDKGLSVAKAIGFPLFIKATAGGGGKGIRIAYNEEDFIIPCIESLEQLRSDFDIEIIVVDNNSTDNTIEKIKDFNIILIEEKKQGVGAARRAGTEAARGTFILHIDADTRIPAGYLDHVLAKFNKEMNLFNFGSMTVGKDGNIFGDVRTNMYTQGILNSNWGIDYSSLFFNVMPC